MAVIATIAHKGLDGRRPPGERHPQSLRSDSNPERQRSTDL